MEVYYQIVFAGELQEGFDQATTKELFAKLMNLKGNAVDRFFTGKEFILKKGLDEAAAMKYAMAVAKTGCACIIELTPDENDISLQPSFVERRKSDRRTNRVARRVVTLKGARTVSRRKTRGRRRADYAFVLTLKE